VLHSGNDLLKEYEALSPDEKIAQKEDFLKRINNLKYFSPKITGYTLRDINGDAVPEYMVFDKDGLISVSAVHEGKISVKPTIEDKLKLSTDGLFYKASCYSNKYGCMAALRYEEEDSYFYLIETARIYFEVAIFGDSGIPTPNYIKIENGERISITEDEYYELQKFYQNPSNQMKPEFVIVSSDIFDNDMKVETRRLKSEDYPAVYKDAPIEYKPVLDGLYALNKFGSDSVYNEETIFGDDDEISADSYAVVDINGDGIKELLLGEDTHIATIHTLDANGKPVLLAAFPKGDDIKVTIGTVYNTGGVLCKWIQADANTPWVVYTYVLEQNATSLIEARLTYDYIDPEDSKTYYGIATEDGLTRYIDKAKFDKFENEIKSVKPLKFTFIPIL
jgi:hypothetical protein